jgi:hypothetical protein
MHPSPPPSNTPLVLVHTCVYESYASTSVFFNHNIILISCRRHVYFVHVHTHSARALRFRSFSVSIYVRIRIWVQVEKKK